jgi:hypothetical protein
MREHWRTFCLLLWLYAIVDALIASFIYSHFYRSIHVLNPYFLMTDLEVCCALHLIGKL